MKKHYYLILTTVLALNFVSCKNNSINITDNPSPSEETTEITQIVENPSINANQNDLEQENANTSIDKETEYEFLYDDDYWKIYDITNAYYKTKEDYEKDVLKYINEISTLLQCEDWFKQYGKEKLYIKLVVEDSNVGGRNIPPSDYTMNSSIMSLIFNVNAFQSNMPLAHELTHVITTKKTNTSFLSISLAEGICDYAANYVGSGITNSSRGLDCNALLKYMNSYCIDRNILTNEEMKDVYKIIGKNITSYPSESFPYPYNFSSIKNYYWFVASDSFTEYLIDTYSIDTVMAIYNADGENIYNNYHEKGLTGMIDDWIQFIESSSFELSNEEIDYAKDYLDRFQF